MNNSSSKWQVTLLKVVFLLIAGMLIRDIVASMFSSLWELITSEWQSAASLSVLFALVAIITNVLSTKIKNDNKQNQNKPNNFQQNNQNQNR